MRTNMIVVLVAIFIATTAPLWAEEVNIETGYTPAPDVPSILSRPSIVLRAGDYRSREAVGPMISALTATRGVQVRTDASSGPIPDYIGSVEYDCGRGARQRGGLDLGQLGGDAQRESVWAFVRLTVLDARNGFSVVTVVEAEGRDTATSWRGKLDLGRRTGLSYEDRSKPSPEAALAEACQKVARGLAVQMGVRNFDSQTGQYIGPRRCPECGTEVGGPESNYCTRCGCKLPPVSPPNPRR